MPIIEDQAGTATHPVVRRAAIGEKFVGAYIKHKSRDRLKDGQPIINTNTRKPRQELVVHAVVMPGTTATVGNSEDFRAAEVGEVVRLILKGRSYSQWIDGINGLKGVQRAGDIVEMVIDQAQVYDADGNPTGQPITTQAEADKVPRGRSLGFYGPLTLRACTAAEMPWVTQADAAFATIGAGRTASGDGEPF